MANTWNPTQYEKFKDQRSQPFFDLMNLLEPHPGAKVIDLGCGSGELTATLHKHLQAKETLGIDSSPEMLQKAQAFTEQNLTFKKANIAEWTAQEEYDVVLSNAALQWCTDHPQIFANIRKALKPNGQLAVQMPMNHDYPTHILAQKMSHEKRWNDLLKGEAYDKFDSMLLMEQYATLLFNLGFQKQNVFTKVYGHVLGSREEVVEWVKGSMLTFFQGRLSKEDYELFLAEFSQRLFAELPDDRPFFFPFKRILMWARL